MATRIHERKRGDITRWRRRRGPHVIRRGRGHGHARGRFGRRGRGGPTAGHGGTRRNVSGAGGRGENRWLEADGAGSPVGISCCGSDCGGNSLSSVPRATELETQGTRRYEKSNGRALHNTKGRTKTEGARWRDPDKQAR